MWRFTPVLGMVAATIYLGAQAPAAPVRPSFAGTWQLQNPKDGPWSAFGSWFTATQDANSLRLDIHTIQTLDDYPGSPATMTVDREVRTETLPLHGESRMTLTPKPAEDTRRLLHDLNVTIAEPTGTVIRSEWAGDQLVVVKRTVYVNTNPPGRMPQQFESEETIWMALRLDTPERLIVDSLTISDPVEMPVRQSAPSPNVVTYYRRH